MRSVRPFEPLKPRATCLFEYVYFARPDAVLEGASVYEVRKELGRRLAAEHPLPSGEGPGIVIPVPDSGLPAAIGFAESVGAALRDGVRSGSHYVGRTFIEPEDSIRHFGVRLKLNPNRAALAGKRVVVVDDSIVRGTTSRKIVKMLREAGAREVHVRVSSPPTKFPCFYGIDTPSRDELIASTHAPDAIAAFLEADSVGYLSLPALAGAVRTASEATAPPSAESTPGASELRGFCHACFSGEYPVSVGSAGPVRLRVVDWLERPRPAEGTGVRATLI